MAVTFSMRTSEPAAVCETSLPALLNVAMSLLSTLSPLPELRLLPATAGAAGVTPKSDFNPSKPL